MSNPVYIFISYAEQDQQASQELKKSLTILRRKKVLAFFDQHKSVKTGDRQVQLDTALAQARIVLLILSNDYIDSDECFDIQEKALAYFLSQGTAVIPILFNQCNWGELDDLARLQPLPRNKKFITDWTNQDSAFTEIGGEIAELARRLHDESPATPNPKPQIITLPEPKVRKTKFDIQSVRNLLANNKIEDALVSLTQYKGLNKDQRKELILHQSRWYDLQRDVRLDIISNQEAGMERNKITLAILDLLDQLETG